MACLVLTWEEDVLRWRLDSSGSLWVESFYQALCRDIILHFLGRQFGGFVLLQRWSFFSSVQPKTRFLCFDNLIRRREIWLIGVTYAFDI